MNKTIVAVVVIIIISGVLYFIFGSSGGPEVQNGTNINMNKPIEEPAEQREEASQTNETEVTKAFTVNASNFKFDVEEIKVKKGDNVKIILKNTQGTHNWIIDEFGAGTKILEAGQEEIIQFVADKAGTFEYYCSVGTHRLFGMKGDLIVE